jgi:hypothetical protein
MEPENITIAYSSTNHFLFLDVKKKRKKNSVVFLLCGTSLTVLFDAGNTYRGVLAHNPSAASIYTTVLTVLFDKGNIFRGVLAHNPPTTSVQDWTNDTVPHKKHVP